MKKTYYVSVDPGEVRFAICVGEAISILSGRYALRVNYVACTSIRDGKSWGAAEIAKEVDAALRAGGVIGDAALAATVCLIENQHMSGDRGKEIVGAIKAIAQLRGMRDVLKVNAKDRGEHFRFVRLADCPRESNKAYRQRKQEAVRVVRERLLETPDLFAQQVHDAFVVGATTERSGIFDMADAITLAIAHVECLVVDDALADPPDRRKSELLAAAKKEDTKAKRVRKAMTKAKAANVKATTTRDRKAKAKTANAQTSAERRDDDVVFVRETAGGT